MMTQTKYETALKADQHYSKTIETQFPGKTRWTLSTEENAHPEVDAAYRAKVKADEEHIAEMRGGQPPQPSAMSLEDAKAHLAARALEGAFGLSWAEIEHKQGGKLRR